MCNKKGDESMAVTTQERLEILQDVSQSWLDLLKAIRGLNNDQLVKPATAGDWSVKDVMAHITFWESRMIDRIALLECGETPPETTDFETINQEEAAKSRLVSLDEVRAQFDSTHDRLMSQLEVTPLLSRDLVEGNTYGHYNEHLADIHAAFKK